jgi:hypothetical protein
LYKFNWNLLRWVNKIRSNNLRKKFGEGTSFLISAFAFLALVSFHCFFFLRESYFIYGDMENVNIPNSQSFEVETADWWQTTETCLLGDKSHSSHQAYQYGSVAHIIVNRLLSPWLLLLSYNSCHSSRSWFLNRKMNAWMVFTTISHEVGKRLQDSFSVVKVLFVSCMNMNKQY